MSDLPRERDLSKYTFNSDEYLAPSSPVRRDAESGRLVPTDAELIERAAKALYAFCMDGCTPKWQPESSWEAWGDKDYFRRCAKAALKAVGVINGGDNV